MTRKLEKYLRSRAITAPWNLVGTGRANFKAAIIVPALAESETLPKTLSSLAANPSEYLQQTLVAVVVNNRSSENTAQKADNLKTINWLQGEPVSQLNLVWVDAASTGLELPEKEGVGMARKIGFDLALSLLDWGRQPLLISLDADTLVEENYLPAIFEHFASSRAAGATLPFRHQASTDPLLEAAIRHYELYLRSYLFGLQQAGSPYAYHTIGSAFACRAEAYVAAGGMNRRQAGEDFYFLQQVAKIAAVEMLVGTVVRPSPRFSARVPFGTGRAVRERVEGRSEPYRFVSVAAFQILKEWLRLVGDSLQSPATDLLEKATELSPVLAQFLRELSFSATWERLQRNHAGAEKRRSAFHGWFDALRTRQLLTRLDEGLNEPTAELVAELLAWGGYQRCWQSADQLALLEKLQRAVKN